MDKRLSNRILGVLSPIYILLLIATKWNTIVAIVGAIVLLLLLIINMKLASEK